MWIVYKQVGVFTHYLNATGQFQPGIERANKFISKEIAETMAKVHGGTVREV
ncbi:MAG: hypothetical protein KME17_23040 [Cyanosarcina radialis HA8281-LM2]|jgi:hypothetical protein|nr:hypothetical protein [Cyanosarcina radialis HA8281-LM2]